MLVTLVSDVLPSGLSSDPQNPPLFFPLVDVLGESQSVLTVEAFDCQGCDLPIRPAGCVASVRLVRLSGRTRSSSSTSASCIGGVVTAGFGRGGGSIALRVPPAFSVACLSSSSKSKPRSSRASAEGMIRFFGEDSFNCLSFPTI
jgi:hypothetical protein